MATIIRVKRKRDEDPLEILYLTNKKRRDGPKDVLHDSPSNVFKFAGTVKSKTEGISKHVREAIRKEKLEREFKQHQIDIVGAIRDDSRAHISQRAQSNRYKVVSKHRGGGLEELDSVQPTRTDTSSDPVTSTTVQHNNSERLTDNSCSCRASTTDCSNLNDNQTGKSLDKLVDKQSGKQLDKSADKQLRKSLDKGADKQLGKQLDKGADKQLRKSLDKDVDKQSGKQLPIVVKETCKSGDKDLNSVTGCIDPVPPESDSESEDGEASGSDTNSKPNNTMFNLVDVVTEPDITQETSLSSQITCNAEVMEREIVTERPAMSDYVYDIYYTDSQHFDFQQFENDLIWSLGGDWRHENQDVDNEWVYDDDEDDENDENNWRNDYPDDEPPYRRPQQEHYDDELEDCYAFETESGNQLAEWMTWRCNMDGTELSSDEDDLDHYDGDL